MMLLRRDVPTVPFVFTRKICGQRRASQLDDRFFFRPLKTNNISAEGARCGVRRSTDLKEDAHEDTHA